MLEPLSLICKVKRKGFRSAAFYMLLRVHVLYTKICYSFDTVSVDRILSFVKEVNLFDKI